MFLTVSRRGDGLQSHGLGFIWAGLHTVAYFILINGVPQNSFKPTRGIRQGDPLSHYLFISCFEALSNLLVNAEILGSITGIPLAQGQLHIKHLFFGDDSILFCKVNSLKWSRMVDTLDTYERASGLKLNKENNCHSFK